MAEPKYYRNVDWVTEAVLAEDIGLTARALEAKR